MSTVINTVLSFVGAFGFLLYGMKLMSDGIQKSAGEKLQRTLATLAGNRFVGLLTGLFITMIIQSSGATTVMVIGFVNVGIMSLVQAATIIYGANIGTTITAQIVALGLSSGNGLSTTAIFAASEALPSRTANSFRSLKTNIA